MKTVFKNSFYKSVRKIDSRDLKVEIALVINEVESASGPRNIRNLKKLSGYEDCYRIKVQDYRIGVKILKDTVYFVAFEHRKNIYRIFP